ncbi:MAG: neuromedin U [Proteobacteria bacterium]|nr:neuromedin U [Pseudomonadota bacterium]
MLVTLFACQAGRAQQSPASSDSSLTTSGSGGEPSGGSTEALQKATQNPVADLISVPLQNNSNFGIGSHDRTQDVLNVQPVIPAHLTQDWNLITRIIQPIVWQPDTNASSGGTFGLGDMNPTFFFSPAHPGRVIWGAGPAFVLPTATDSTLGQGKWSIGPSFVALTQPEHWTLGVLLSNVWSFAGSSDRASVNQMLFQYFINYNLSHGWYVTSSPIITANWAAKSAKDIWTVPFGGGVGRIMKLGDQPVNISAQVYANAIYPSGTSRWGLRLQVAFLFPK